MNNKLIFAFLLIVGVCVAWTLGRNTSIDIAPEIKTPDVEYQVDDIQAVQTNEQGETEYTLNAKSLIRNQQTNEETLAEMQMSWQPAPDKHYSISSTSANFNQEAGQLIVRDGFSLVAKLENIDSVRIEGSKLTADTINKTISSAEPIEFTQGDNHFKAATMSADVSTGDYQFNNIEMEFDPIDRVEESLF